MIVEERTSTLKPGTLKPGTLHLDDQDDEKNGGLAIQTRILGNLIGYFHVEIGELSKVVFCGAMRASPSARRTAPRSAPMRSGSAVRSRRPTSSDRPPTVS
ncbi:hypothetical protein [Rhodoplanes roseus]|uniref:Uncharacterized protein n=1 Tax=Rhodoplanes roseus TaxID=29409 RepID=A0A327L1G2_9BRAD|nr:hypothetical protein [Rhodoplanes roseus]RAI43805.1 hypothetical protein CH341_12515 [Rhodoplanes roseus]